MYSLRREWKVIRNLYAQAIMKTWIYKRIFSFCAKRKRALPKFLRRKIYVRALDRLKEHTVTSTDGKVDGKVKEGSLMCPQIEIATVEMIGWDCKYRPLGYPFLLPEFSRKEFSKFLYERGYLSLYLFPLKNIPMWLPTTEFGHRLRLYYLYNCAIRCGYSL